jgi:hypothetical protein
MLKILPAMQFPVTGKQFDPLMDSAVQLNILDGGLNEPQQRALGLYLHVFDLWVKSKGKIDYRGDEGHKRLVQDAMTFCGTGNPVATRHGDIAAAHLSIDFSDTQIRCTQSGLPLLPTNVSSLLDGCRDLYGLSLTDEKRVGLLMDSIGKRSL